MLEPDALKSLLADSDPAIMQANYSDSLLGITGRPAIWGQMATQIFAAYQPTNETAAVIVMDGALPEETMADFLGNMSITPTEGVSPLVPGFCPDTDAASAAAAISEEATVPAATAEDVIPADETAVDSSAPSTPVAATPTLAEAAKDSTEAHKEKAAADMKAAKARLDAMRKNRG